MKIFTEFNGTSKPGSLNSRDWRRWIQNLFIFSIPTILAVLYAFQNVLINGRFPNQAEFAFVIGSAFQALGASLLDLLKKYKA